MKTTKNILATAGIAAALALGVAGIPQVHMQRQVLARV